MTADRKPERILGRRDLLATGSVDQEIHRSVRAGELIRITRGWYRGEAPTTKEQDAVDRAVAMLRRAPSLTASDESAALLRSLPVVYSGLDAVHLTRDASRGAKRGSGRVIHAHPLGPTDVDLIDGLRVTSVSRTLVDLGCRSPDPRTVIAAADAALKRRLVEPAAVARALAAAGHRTGVARARFLLGFADGRAESPGESVLRWILAQGGLSEPELQVEVRSAGGRFLARVDLAYLAEGVVLEFDGFVKYQKLLRPGDDVTSVVLREKGREDALREAGLIVIRFVWSDFDDPRRLVGRVRAALVRGRRAAVAQLVTARMLIEPPVRLP